MDAIFYILDSNLSRLSRDRHEVAAAAPQEEVNDTQLDEEDGPMASHPVSTQAGFGKAPCVANSLKANQVINHSKTLLGIWR